MIKNYENIILRGAKALFLMNYSPADTFLKETAYLENSESDKEDYPWLGQSPQMVEANEELEFSDLTDANYTLVNKKFWSGMQFKRDQLSDDKTGFLRQRVLELAEVASYHPEKLRSDVLLAGFESKCYDGAPFYGKHGKQSNLLTGSGNTVEAFSEDFKKAKASLKRLKADNGEPFFGAVPLTLWCEVPSEMEYVAKKALSATIVASDSNVLVGQAQIRENNRLPNDKDWYLHAVTLSKKPFILQQREALEFDQQESSASDAAFLREIYRYKVRARYTIGYGYWQCSIAIKNSEGR